MEKSVSVLGCGWYGLPLAKQLLKNGFKVRGSTTNEAKMDLLLNAGIEPFLIESTAAGLSGAVDFFQSTILIICIPPKRSAGEQDNFSDKIREIIKAAKKGKTAYVLFISSTSVYGDLNRIVTESDEPKPLTASGKAMVAAEDMLRAETSFKTTILRFAGLVGPDRDPARFFAGKKDVANGRAPINLIHLEDCIGITLAILDQHLWGLTLNACCPDHPEKQIFYTSASLRSGLAAPHFIDELTTWKIVASSHMPSVLFYNFKISTWSGWLNTDKI